jgi:hypothetical protein
MKLRLLLAVSIALAGVTAAFSRAAPPPKAPARSPASAPAGSAAAKAVARLKADEAGLRSGRLTLLSQHRRVDLPEGTKPAAAMEAASRAPLFSQRREYLLFSGKNWRRDITVMDPQGNVGVRYQMGMNRGVGRMLQEIGEGEKATRTGSLGINPEENAADQVLLGRAAELLGGITWTSAKAEDSRLVLTGARGDQRITLALRTKPHHAVERLVMTEPVVTPEGSVTQGLEITAAYEPAGARLAPKTVQHLVYAVGTVNRAMLTTYKVEGARLNDPIRPDELAIAFPEGTRVTDSRVDPPVRYLQGEKELTLTEVKSLGQQRAETGARIGAPAPGWELKTLDGKPAKLADYRGKVVLLTWFASW